VGGEQQPDAKVLLGTCGRALGRHGLNRRTQSCGRIEASQDHWPSPFDLHWGRLNGGKKGDRQQLGGLNGDRGESLKRGSALTWVWVRESNDIRVRNRPGVGGGLQKTGLFTRFKVGERWAHPQDGAGWVWRSIRGGGARSLARRWSSV